MGMDLYMEQPSAAKNCFVLGYIQIVQAISTTKPPADLASHMRYEKIGEPEVLCR